MHIYSSGIFAAGLINASHLFRHGLRPIQLLTQPSFQASLNAVCLKICARLMPPGDGEIRTLDPLLARQVLSQLSYTPI